MMNYSVNFKKSLIIHKENTCLASVFIFDTATAISYRVFFRNIIINPRIILQMSRSTTNVFEAVQSIS